MQYIKRIIEKKLAEYIRNFPAVYITGPRQSGKSTMIQQHLSKDYQYVTFDDMRAVNLLQDDPERFMSIYNNHIIFDEVQKVPEIFPLLKRHIDNDRQNYGKFILTGSNQLILHEKVTESLAGRIGILELLPFQVAELPQNCRPENLFKGAYPELVMRDYRAWQDWYASYIDTYINKDVRQLSNIGDLRDFRRLLMLLSANVSQQLNMSTLANDIGVSVPTVKRWISILESAFIIFLLPPFYKNLGKRITKSPKIYFYDCGLVSFLTGIETEKNFENGPLTGPLFENHVISEIVKKEMHNDSHCEFFYYKATSDAEVDLIIDRHHSLDFFEIKSSYTFKPSMVKHLEAFEKESSSSFLLYRGESMPFTADIKVSNYREYLLS